MKFFKNLVSEESTVSCVRVMALLAILIAGLLAFYGIYANKDLVGVSALVTAFITPAFAAKVMQKKIEKTNQ